MTMIIPFPDVTAIVRRMPAGRRAASADVIEFRPRKAEQTGGAKRSDLPQGEAGRRVAESKTLTRSDVWSILCLGFGIAAIFGLLSLNAPRAAFADPIDQLADPFTMQYRA